MKQGDRRRRYIIFCVNENGTSIIEKNNRRFRLGGKKNLSSLTKITKNINCQHKDVAGSPLPEIQRRGQTNTSQDRVEI